ncbi:tRNA-dihydrouridine synthase [Fictibacillus fluitans]|uniref:tRNA-dihydrouridine synthase n=1 Tax=Fictibacillus fluitans TaxID=3058422 RepID=A0ABT8HTD5_9BACL|nr:tRNA-dihydrouridine synthase [Fictibacillus sp. NE201]MDN4524047.1 tRNA-dihydrouridine synthase [Fictibacillus sp. NE201]
MPAIINTPFAIGEVTLNNRLMMAPMQQNGGTIDAYATNHHIKHYKTRAGGIGLIIVESTAVSPNGRLYKDDIGIYSDRHIEPLARVVDAVHFEETPIFIQLSHGGRKSWPEVTEHLLAPSAIKFDDHYGTPNEMSALDIKNAVEEYRLAARRSVQAGFDGIEIHAAHGYLLHQFLSPISNQRTDEYGGSLENRSRLVKEVLSTVRDEVGTHYPVQIRVSASDFLSGGLTPNEVAQILKGLEAFLDAVHVSAGGILPIQPKSIYSGYQVPYAAVIKQELEVPVIAVGNIHNADMMNQIIEDNLADFIAIGRPLLEDAKFAEKILVNS